MKKTLVALAALSGFFIAQKSFATCSNYTTYTSGQTLTSSSLNSLQSNYTNCINEVLNGDIFTGNMLWYSGSNIAMYSDTGSTLKFSVDGTSGNITTEGQINLGTGGVVLNDDGDGALTITGAGNGSDEDLTLNLDDTSNTAVVSSSTGVTSLGMNGIGMNVYSDSGSTLKAKVEASSGAAILGLTQAGQVTNCGMSVSGSTFTIAGYDGTALSATNPCVVAIESFTPGRVQLAYFTSNVTFTFGSSSDTDSNLFGITDANWSNVMPFFIGVVGGSTPYFTISRVPLRSTGSASPDVCQKTDTDCDAQSDAMILSTGLTLASFTSLPITQIGWFAITYATSGGAWTATVPINSGFNKNYESVLFTFPSGQNGAASGTHLHNNGGTAPAFLNTYYNYNIYSSGNTSLYIYIDTDGGTDGATHVQMRLATPYSNSGFTNSQAVGNFRIDFQSQSFTMVRCSLSQNVTYLLCTRPSVSGSALQNTTTTFWNDDFTDGTDRFINGSIIYPTLQ